MLATTSVILVVVRDMRVGNIKNPGVGYGYTVGIAGNILEDLIDTFSRRLRIDNPRRLFTIPSYFLADDDIILFELSSEQGHEPSVEFVTHSTDGKEEVTVFTAFEMMPHATIIHSASRHNAVNVRMVEQIRAPRMEDRSHTGKQASAISECFDGGPCRLEHTIVEDSLMCHRNRMQTGRNSEYDMEVLHGDNLLPSEINPLLALLVLTLGTMPVTTAVVADMHVTTLRTHLHMSAKGTGTAKGHVSEGSSDRCYDVMTAKELSSMVPDNLTNVEAGPHFFGGKMTSIRRT